MERQVSKAGSQGSRGGGETPLGRWAPEGERKSPSVMAVLEELEGSFGECSNGDTFALGEMNVHTIAFTGVSGRTPHGRERNAN